ncbi:MAG: B12-binding domain-containing radical SAM protein [Phototrophicaceae bacterium]
MRHSIILYNPVSTSPGKQRLPLSLLAVAAPIANDYDTIFIDGNLIADPAAAIIEAAQRTNAKLLAVTVMPGPQLRQAVPVCKAVKAACPDIKIVWGGYFASNHTETVANSGIVDYAIVGQGEAPFSKLVDTLHYGGALADVPSMSYCEGGTLHQTARAPYLPLDRIPTYPYERIDVARYVGKSYLGQRVLSHNSSFGCPFDCNFCAVVALAKKRWLAESAARVGDIATEMKKRWNIDGLEFHDMDFFVHEARTAEIAERFKPLNIHWWGLGRVDTLMGYSDDTFHKLADSGCKMIFMGAESGSDETLKRMNKGGRSSTSLTLQLVERMKHFGIIPELSFVMGNPPDPLEDIDITIGFIRQIKEINPDTELILYIYTPVPQEGSIMMEEATRLGFAFPATLEAWASDEWAHKSMRRDPGTPWFTDNIRRRVRDFETVVNAYYPTVTDTRLRGNVRHVLRVLSGWRYHTQLYAVPYELKALQRVIHYRRPETTGF